MQQENTIHDKEKTQQVRMNKTDTDDKISRQEYYNSYYNSILFVLEDRGKIEHVSQRNRRYKDTNLTSRDVNYSVYGKNAVDGINNNLNIPKEKINDHKYVGIKSLQNKMQKEKGWK